MLGVDAFLPAAQVGSQAIFVKVRRRFRHNKVSRKIFHHKGHKDHKEKKEEKEEKMKREEKL
jgi:hypothetical protein